MHEEKVINEIHETCISWDSGHITTEEALDKIALALKKRPRWIIEEDGVRRRKDDE